MSYSMTLTQKWGTLIITILYLRQNFFRYFSSRPITIVINVSLYWLPLSCKPVLFLSQLFSVERLLKLEPIKPNMYFIHLYFFLCFRPFVWMCSMYVFSVFMSDHGLYTYDKNWNCKLLRTRHSIQKTICVDYLQI